MYDADRQLNHIAVRTKGLLVRRHHPEIPRHVWDRRVAERTLDQLYEGIYRHPAVPVTTDMRWLAAVLACGDDAVLSHRAGAALLGWPNARRIKPEVTSPHTDLPRIEGVDLHRAVRLRPFERTVVRGIPVTAPGKTALDYCAVTPLHIASEVIAEAVVTKLLKPEAVVSTLERSTGRGIRGTTKLRSIALLLDEIAELESVLELHGARELELARMPRGVPQYELVCSDGRLVRFDRAWPEVRLGLDFDGKRWHGTPARKKRTRQRHDSIVASDWEHLTYGWSDVHDTPADMRREAEGTYHRLWLAAAA